MKTDVDIERESADIIADVLGLDRGQIEVRAQAGEVLLNGQVERLAEKWLAEYLARSVYGVRATVNRIVVGQSAADAATHSLRRSPQSLAVGTARASVGAPIGIYPKP